MIKQIKNKTALKEFFESFVLWLCLFTVIFMTFSGVFAFDGENIKPKSVVKMHVVANSDSQIDQTLKLKVRDTLLQVIPLVFDGCDNIDKAKAAASRYESLLRAVALGEIKSQGFDYDVKIVMQNKLYEKQTLGDIILPAGEYFALSFIIGEGGGKNWWGVVFPGLYTGDSVSLEKMQENLYSAGFSKDKTKSIIDKQKENSIKVKNVYVKSKALDFVFGLFK